MRRLRLLVTTLAAALLPVAALMAAGDWCQVCQIQKDEVCKAGKCLEEERTNHIDLEALHHVPAVDFCGGDGGGC